MSLMKILMVMVAVSLGCASANCASSFSPLAEACLGDNLTFECSIAERVGSTVFQGGFLDCSSSNEIVLLHSHFKNMTASVICNNGKVRGYSLSVNDSEPCYTSQLQVMVSPDIIGRSITCTYDDGTTAEETGNYSIEQCHATTVTTIAPSTAIIIHENNTKSSMTMESDMRNKAIKSLSSGEATAIVLCCSAIIVGIMIAIIIILTCGLILKKKQLHIIRESNSGHTTIQEESIATSTSTANVGQQQSQATFHCALNDEVSGYTLCTTDYDYIVTTATGDCEYDRLQHPGGQHAPHSMESRAHLQLT